MGLASLFRQLGSSVGTTDVGAIVGAVAAASSSVAMANSIQEAVLVQGGAGALMVAAAWFMADPPLGTARQPADVEMSAKGQAWNPVAADR
jgi:hypothetical protein